MKTPQRLWATCASFNSPLHKKKKKKKFLVHRWNFISFNLCFLILVPSVDTTERSASWALSTVNQAQYQSPYSQPLLIWQMLQSLTTLAALHWTAVKSFLYWGLHKWALQMFFPQCWADHLPQPADNFLPQAAKCWPFWPWGCNAG